MTKLLSRQDVIKVLSISDTVNILENAFSELSNGNVNMPQRTPITTPKYEGLALFMPAYLEEMGALGAKIVTVYKNNPQQYNMATVLGTIILIDEKTGSPLSIMDGGYLTAMRTGGVAGLATKHLSRKDSRIHTIFGTGDMAGAHAQAIDFVRDVEKVNLYSIDPLEKRERFRDYLSDELGIKCDIVLAEDPESAVREADIVTLITSAQKPIVDGTWFTPGTHINGIGSHAPAARELDTKTVQISKVVCDLVDACAAEAGDFIIPVEAGDYKWDDIHGSLGDVITKKVSGRENNDELTLFKSVGLAIQDLSVAYHVFNKSIEMGVGMDFEF